MALIVYFIVFGLSEGLCPRSVRLGSAPGYPRLVTIHRSIFLILWAALVHASRVFNSVFGLKIQFMRHGLAGLASLAFYRGMTSSEISFRWHLGVLYVERLHDGRFHHMTRTKR